MELLLQTTTKEFLGAVEDKAIQPLIQWLSVASKLQSDKKRQALEGGRAPDQKEFKDQDFCTERMWLKEV